MISAWWLIPLGLLTLLAAREILSWDLAGPDGEPLPPDPRPILQEEPRHKVAQAGRRQHTPHPLPVLTPADVQGLVDVGAGHVLITARDVELEFDHPDCDWSIDEVLRLLCQIETL